MAVLRSPLPLYIGSLFVWGSSSSSRAHLGAVCFCASRGSLPLCVYTRVS